MTAVIIVLGGVAVLTGIAAFGLGYDAGYQDGEYVRGHEYINPRNFEPVEQPKCFDHRIGTEEDQLKAQGKEKAPLRRQPMGAQSK